MWLALTGALAYSSWPLAFLVNPSLAGSALASSFEGPGQPFNWLFVLLDGFTGLCALAVCVRQLRPRPGRRRPGRAHVVALLGYGGFGVATAVDAVVPLSCGALTVRACASQVWPLTPDDCLTGVAMLALLMAAAVVAAPIGRKPWTFSSAAPVIGVLIGWSALGLVVLLDPSTAVAVISQYAFLTLTSILAFIVPAGCHQVLARDMHR